MGKPSNKVDVSKTAVLPNWLSRTVSTQMVKTSYQLNDAGALERLIQPVFPPRKPADMSFIEHELYEINAADHAWRKQYLAGMPDYLAGYFGRRYEKLFNEKGRRAANTFLRVSVGSSVLPRLQLVNERYQMGPVNTGFLPFPFSDDFQKLPTYDRDQIRNLSYSVARFIEESFSNYVDRVTQNEKGDDVVLDIYRYVAELVKPFDITPPYWSLYKNEKITERNILSAVAKMTSPTWWKNQLKRRRDLQREHMAIAVGQVQKAVSPYVSRSTLGEWKEQKRRNWEFFKNHELEDEDGNRCSLADMVLASNANPAKRRTELMVRMRGFEDLADHMGCVGEFYTITAPSRFHSARSSGGLNNKWDGSSPRDAQKYLCRVWSRIRAALAREDIRIFGFRVVEPHHDGTPHWHMLLFMRPECIDAARDIMCYHARIDDSEELQSQKALKARFHVEPIDKSKGSATGYIAKYISKNIDGFALGDEVDDETGEKCSDMSKHITAWASRWRIRQFQQIGGAPVTVWRELRRLRGEELEDPDMDKVLVAADVASDWAAYTEYQGGALVARKDLTVRLSYDTIEEAGQYAEEVKKICGIYSPFSGISSQVSTRQVKWTIVPKSSAQADEALNSGRDAAPWSSVNNCTPKVRRVRKEIEKQLISRGEIGAHEQVSILMRGSILKVDEYKALKYTNGQLIEALPNNNLFRYRKTQFNHDIEQAFYDLGI